MTGDYWYGEKGGWVFGAKCVLVICKELGLRVRPGWLADYGLSGVTSRDLLAEYSAG